MVTKSQKAEPKRRRNRKQMLEAVAKVDALIASGMTKTAACEEVKLNVLSYNKATKSVAKAAPRPKTELSLRGQIADLNKRVRQLEKILG